MDIQQAVYFELHEAFEREQIEFAYPTLKLWLSSSTSNLQQALLRAPDAERIPARR